MLIVVCIKQVPDTTQVQIDPVTNTLIREGIPFIANPYDTHALEEALRLKDRFGFRVTAISMGPPNAEATLRKALALGVDQAILLSDRVFGGADTLATSKVLSAAIEKLHEEEEVGLVFAASRPSTATLPRSDPALPLGPVHSAYPGRPGRRARPGDEKNPGQTQAGRTARDRRSTAAGHAHRGAGVEPSPLSDRSHALDSQDTRSRSGTTKSLKLDVNTIGLKGSPTWVSRIFSPQREKGEIIGDGVHDPEGTAQLLIDKLLSKDLLAI